jgi:iron complex transport system ATP-binding protein
MSGREASGDPLLSCQGLDIGFKGKGGRTVLRDARIDLRGGSLVCLIGPNGSGKSTLLNVLGGLQPPLRGRVLIGGQDIAGMGSLERARAVSMVLAESPRPAWTSGREVVALGRYAHTGFFGRPTASDGEAVERAIRAMGAEELAGRDFFRLSDGERQKLLMARAIAQESPLLLMDEPTMYLDAPSRRESLGLLRRLAREEGRAIVIALHEIDLALEYGDELWIVSQAEKRLIRGLPEALALRGEISLAFGLPHAAASLSSEHASPSEILFPEGALATPIGSLGLNGPDGPVLYWTRKLIKRLGFLEARSGADAVIEITGDAETPPRWTLAPGERHSIDIGMDGRSCASIEELAQILLGLRYRT